MKQMQKNLSITTTLPIPTTSGTSGPTVRKASPENCSIGLATWGRGTEDGCVRFHIGSGFNEFQAGEQFPAYDLYCLPRRFKAGRWGDNSDSLRPDNSGLG
ncbi:MAG: hypothetical protein GY866_08580 [Proteobacteria bacterium]|nr:hypothetical protein [Pseudomonadota bacterium]